MCMIYSNYDIHLRATMRCDQCDLNGNELKKYASINANVD